MQEKFKENSNGIITLLNGLIEKAVELKASDLHIEPRQDYLRIRYRVDGLLQDGAQLDKELLPPLISRIKVMVNLDIAECRLPQDGRCHLNVGRKHYDARVSTIPTLHGEKAVLRFLDRQQSILGLEELGMEAVDSSVYQSLISKKNGLILVAGPTGSGKTTTLYATLSRLNSKETNIITIEDPIEYQLKGINQIQVHPKIGLTFAKGLRHILRQDPDIIMVGEIRDLETAKIALQAALTGHLVFSTLHTQNAASAVTRLVDMGIEPFLVNASVIGVVAQRLVRKIGGGRTAIFEVLPALNLNGTYGSGRGVSPQRNMKTLAENGMAKVKQGLIIKEELSRVISLE